MSGTIGSGGTYANELAWVAAIPAVLTGNEVGTHLAGETNNSATDIVLSGITVGVFSISLTADTGASFIDMIDPTVGPVRYSTSPAACLMSSGCISFHTQVPISITRMQFHKSSNYDQLMYVDGGGAAGTVIDQNIFKISAGGSSGMFRVSGATLSRRNIWYSQNNVGGLSFGAINVDSWNELYANIANGGGTLGFLSSYSSSKANNVAVVQHATAFSGTSAASSTNNATDQASLGGTGFNGGTPQTSLTPTTELVSVTSGAEDFRLAQTSAKLRANGNATGAPSTDMFGRTWNSGIPDIGPMRFDLASTNEWKPPPVNALVSRPRHVVGY